jgi:DNA-binding transcriptional regulator GbsR (MarR family)
MARSHAQFIEEVGITAEGDGLPRIAGRLFGYLLLSPEPRSLDEIADALAVSKGSASTDARLLLRHGWLRRVSQPGDRKDYYELAPDFFAEIVSYRLTRWEALHDLVAGAMPELTDAPSDVLDRLDYLERAQRFFVDGIRALLSEWRIASSANPATRGARG